MDVQNYRADSIQHYHLTEDIIHGTSSDDFINYDLISIIILNLGKHKTSHVLLNLLHLLFMDLTSSAEKETILQNTYHLELSNTMRKDMTKMGSLIEPLLNIGIQQGVEKVLQKATDEAAEKAAKQAATEATEKTLKSTRIESIRNLMDSTQWSAQQAMNALKIPPDEQSQYLPLI